MAPSTKSTQAPEPVPVTPPAAAAQGAETQGLGPYLVQNGLLTADQLREALDYARENNLDLRQAILEKNLIPPEQLTALAFEHLQSLAGLNGAVAPPRPRR